MRYKLISLFLLSLSGISFAQSGKVEAHIAQFDGDRAAAISYTFDDNLRDQYTLAVPLLNKAGFKATFFVIPSATAETPEEAIQKDSQKRAWGGITWSELKEMSDGGHEIASHTWSHPNLTKLTPEEVDTQLSKSLELIRERIGVKPLTLAFPFNASTPAIQVAALKYYLAFRAYQIGTGEKTTTDALNKWADSLVKEHKWGVTMTHAVAHGYAAMSSPAVLGDHFDYVRKHSGEIWVDTFANVARYSLERENSQLAFTQDGNVIRGVITSTLDPKVFNVPLTVVIKLPRAHVIEAFEDDRPLPVEYTDGSVHVRVSPDGRPIVIRSH